MREDITDIVLTEEDKYSMYKCVCFNVIGQDIVSYIKVDMDNKIFKFKRLNGPRCFLFVKTETISFKEFALLAKEFCFKRAQYDLISSRNFCKYSYENGTGTYGKSSSSEEEAIIETTYKIIENLHKQGRL